MSMNDIIADAMVNLKNHENASLRVCYLRPASKLLGEILRVMLENKFIGGFERIDDGREGIYKVELIGKINECRAVKPRHAVKKNEFEKFEKRYLPSRDIGILIVTTPKGVFTHAQTKDQDVGGRLLAYVY